MVKRKKEDQAYSVLCHNSYRMIGTPPLLGTGHPFFYSVTSSEIGLAVYYLTEDGSPIWRLVLV